MSKAIVAGSYKNAAITVFVAICAGAALVLRLWQINGALWYDEAFSAYLAGLPVSRLIEATAGDVHPPAYYLLLWFLTRVAGNSELVLRLPSLLAGLGLIGVVYRLGLALHLPARVVYVATGLTAIAPWQITYSTEARSYELLTLAVALAALGLIERRYWLAIVSSLAALYLHNLAAPFVAAVWLASVQFSAPYMVAAIITGFLYIPGLVWTINQTLAVSAGYWIPGITPGRVIAAFDDLVFFAPNNPFVLSTALLTALALVLIALDWRTNNRFLMVTCGLPVLFLAAVSVFVPVFQSRSIAPVAPFYYLLLASAVTRNTRRLHFGCLGVSALALTLAGGLAGPLARDTTDWNMLHFYGNEQPNDAIYHTGIGSYVVWHYYRPDIPQFLLPQDTTIEQTLSDNSRRAMAMAEIDFDFIKCTTLADGKGNSTHIDRWWLIYFNNPVTTDRESAAVEYLKQYATQPEFSLRNDPTTEAGMVLLNPECK